MKKYIGCSGYYYKDWKRKFYPESLPQKKWFDYYTQHFNAVEINNTFYNMPTVEKLKNWHDSAPEDFAFAIKGNRFFTHQKKLKIDEAFKDRLKEFQDLLSHLGDKTGCVLWQLPRNLKQNTEKLEAFCQLLDNHQKHVLEFRHHSWWDIRIYEILRKYKVAFCLVSTPVDLPEDPIQTADFTYFRFHGSNEWYNHDYQEDELKRWKNKLSAMKNLTAFFAFFNNDYNANAVQNAQAFRGMLD